MVGGIELTNKQVYTCFKEAANYTEPDTFASDVAMSLLNPDDPGQEVDMELFEQLRILWRVANDDFRDFLAQIGMSQTECSTRFCIPLRTIQDWAGDRRTPPPYVRLMMAEAVGLVKIR